MLGVVIWTDTAESKAIIWCEDHGDLAFLGQHSHAGGFVKFDQGDLIQFDLAEHRSMRLAKNARKIAQHYCSDLEGVLAKAQSVRHEIENDRDHQGGSADRGVQGQKCTIIDFAETRQALNLQR